MLLFLSCLNSDLVNRNSVNNLTTANALNYANKNYDIAVNASASLTGIGSVGYGYFYNRFNGTYNLQHYYDMQNQCIYERLLVSTADKDWNRITTNSDLEGRFIFLPGGTAMQSPYNNGIGYRLQIDYKGNITLYKTTNSGSSWDELKTL